MRLSLAFAAALLCATALYGTAPWPNLPGGAGPCGRAGGPRRGRSRPAEPGARPASPGRKSI